MTRGIPNDLDGWEPIRKPKILARKDWEETVLWRKKYYIYHY